MRRKRRSRRWLPFLIAAAVVMTLTGVYAFFARPAEHDAAVPLRFTSVSFAEENGTAATKTDLSKCIVTLAYVEFQVDGRYHTPKVTITYQGRKLKKNVDYKVIFSGGKDAGTSSVIITGVGDYTGVVTKTYQGIPAPTQSTTAANAPAAKKKTTAATKATKAAAKKTTTAATKKAKSGVKSAAKSETETEPTNPRAAPAEPVITAAEQSITSIDAYTFSDSGKTASLGAAASSGLGLIYTSSEPGIVSVDAEGVMQAKKAGTATITITQEGNDQFKPVSKTLNVVVPSFRSREAALAHWKHILIDTFFHINDRKYSHGDPGKYWKDSKGNWSGKTGKKGNTQSCVTISTVSLKRIGLLSENSGCIWLDSNHGTKPNGTVRRLKKSSKTLSISYPHKSLKELAEKDMIRYGDILCRSGHTFVYMGKDAGGHPLIYESGSRRDIGSGTCVVWGHHSGGHADKLTGKINKQITKSNAVGKKWRQGKLSDDAFKGHQASGNNLNKPAHIVCSIRTFKVRTSCVNGTITPGSIYMAGEDVTINYAASPGKSLEYVKVDGRKVNAKSKFTFKNIKGDHSVAVRFKT